MVPVTLSIAASSFCHQVAELWCAFSTFLMPCSTSRRPAFALAYSTSISSLSSRAIGALLRRGRFWRRVDGVVEDHQPAPRLGKVVRAHVPGQRLQHDAADVQVRGE